MYVHTKAIIITALLLPFSALAGEADIIDVQVSKTSKDTYRFDVTVSHADSGWEHYANKWDIVDKDGNVLGTRTLHHPHENEQPFTRGLSDIHISSKNHSVTVRAHDFVHQYGGKTITVDLP
ncbi:hypothetical protein [Vibrio sp. F74]|uniref:hypothetical protein n=1 Tax=Vibrio sp. F74 TaxID=700020 RepID=UPI0035F57C78